MVPVPALYKVQNLVMVIVKVVPISPGNLPTLKLIKPDLHPSPRSVSLHHLDPAFLSPTQDMSRRTCPNNSRPAFCLRIETSRKASADSLNGCPKPQTPRAIHCPAKDSKLWLQKPRVAVMTFATSKPLKTRPCSLLELNH